MKKDLLLLIFLFLSAAIADAPDLNKNSVIVNFTIPIHFK